jgi:hypothetical protein
VNKIDTEYLEYVADMLKQIRDELRYIRHRVTEPTLPPLPPLPLFPGPVIVRPSWPTQIREDGTYSDETYSTRTFCTAEPAAKETP